MFKRAFPFHTFLLALYPLVFLLNTNSSMLPFGQAVFPGLALVAFTGLVLFCAWCVYRNRYKAGLFASGFMLLFQNYGFFANVVFRFGVTRHYVAVLLWTLFAATLFWLIGRIKFNLAPTTKIVNVMAAALIAFNVFAIVSDRSKPCASLGMQHFDVNAQNVTADKPDVYIILLDAYARGDVLKFEHRFDNTAFLDGLRQRGFYVADSSHSNYPHTLATLSSMLNMQYLPKPPGLWRDSRPFRDAVHDNQVFGLFERMGYDVYAFPTGFEFADITAANRYEGFFYLDDLSLYLINQTPLVVLPLVNAVVLPLRRKILLHPYERAKQLVGAKSPKLVYIHTVSPHPPFIFQANGDLIKVKSFDNRWRQGPYYTDQIKFLNGVVTATVDTILARSSRPPIIVVFSDHGSKMKESTVKAEDNDFGSLFSNLFAAYLPGKERALYQSITPVNMFRVIFSEYFGAKLPLLPDSSYYYPMSKHATFLNVNDKIRQAEMQRAEATGAR